MFKLIPRENVSPVLSLLGPLFSVGLTMIVGGILFYFLGVDPFAAIKKIFWDPLMSETFSLGINLNMKHTPNHLYHP